MVLPGFNTDFKHKGQVYHAQTEDNGVNNPVVVTLLYLKGAILSSRKTAYGDLLEKENYQQALMDLMKSQHRDIMKEVLSGKFDTAPREQTPAPQPEPTAVAAEPVVAATEPSGEPKSLDEAIMEFLDGYASGKAESA